MTPETLRPADKRFVLVCILVCAASLFIGIRYFQRAFPEASIDFRVNRDTSRPLAERFLQDRALPLSGYRHASAFRYDDEAKVFLERELGLERANGLMPGEIKMWRWGHRWFRPLEKEEIRVEITTRGELASFVHVLPEETPGADLQPAAAREIAESFLSNVIRRPPGTLEFLDRQSRKRPKRTDHVLTWKVSGMELRGATYRVSVTVQGDRVDGYSEFLKLPEQWQRDYARLRSLNESTSLVDSLLFVLLGIGMLVSLAGHIRLRNTRWRTALIFGLVAFALQFLAALNEFPVAQYDFDTTGTYASFVGRVVIRAGLIALAFGGLILLLTACTEPVYRSSYPKHLSIRRMLSWPAIRTRSFLLASLAGITLTFFFFAYEIGFYLLANRLGAWAPADIPYTELLNTRFPWVFVLFMGFFPAVSEEWMFRAFGIPWLERLLRRRWVALVLASFIWGFGHAAYPNQPFFIRGIEVGIVGLILGWAMLKFGILAPLIAHYSIDAFYTAFLLLRSGDTYLAASGAVTAGINLIPLLLALGAYVVKRRFNEESAVANESEGMPAPQVPTEKRTESLPVTAYTPLGRRPLFLVLAIFTAGIALAPLKAPRYGDSVAFRLPKQAAEDAARKFLWQQGHNTADYKVVTQPKDRSDPSALQYVYTVVGTHGLNSIYGEAVVPAAWSVRFFKPLQKEEFRVDVDPGNGRVVAFQHLLPEEAPGADLPEAQAQQIAQRFLEDGKLDLGQFELKETKSEKPKARRDTDFTWEAKPGTRGAAGEARARAQVGIKGDKVGVWTRYFKVPEHWQRARERQNVYSLSVLGIRILLIVVLFAVAALMLVRGTRQGTIQWRRAALVAGIAVIFELAHSLNSIPVFASAYDTRLSSQVFTLAAIVGSAISVLGFGLLALLAAGLIMACYPDAFSTSIRNNLPLWRRDAIGAAGALVGVYLLFQAATGWLGYAASGRALAPSLLLPPHLGTYVPFVSGARDILVVALFCAAAAAFATRLWLQHSHHPLLCWSLVAWLILSFLPVSARRFSEAMIDVMPTAVLVLAAWLLVRYLFRDNYAAYFVAPALLASWRSSASWLAQGNTSLAVQGVLLLLVMIAAALALFTRSAPQAKLAQ
ncbi:MAG: CPBP family intramembrane metalloprotease [Acidobacteria bacterium]|nr:CPBP family intramembrane metalloprotease [Acidobacteriota bacterium]